MSKKSSLIILYCSATIAFSQVRVGDWAALTSPLRIRDVVYVTDDLYAATEGGLYIISNQEFKTLTTIEGLENVDLNQVELDKNNHLWLGGASPNGFLQLFDPIKEESIQIFDFGLNEIYDIQLNDSLAWVSFMDGQDLGIMKFVYTSKWEYRDSFRNFPVDANGFNCFTVSDSIIYLGTDSGIYSGLISDNLKDPNRWTPVDVNMTMNVNAMAIQGSTFLFASSTSVFQLDQNSNEWSNINSAATFSNISNLYIDDVNHLTAGKNHYQFNLDGDFSFISNEKMVNVLAFHDNGHIVGTNHGLFLREKESESFPLAFSSTSLIPNAPVVNHFTSITVLDDGRLVGGSKRGLSIYNGEGWRNIIRLYESNTDTIHEDYDYTSFIADTLPILFGEYIADLEQGPDGRLYCAIRGTYPTHYSHASLRGGGVLSIDIDYPEDYLLIDTTYLSYHTTSSNQNPYMVVLDVEFDNANNMWIANPYCINGNNPIHVQASEGSWRAYGSSETNIRISQSPGAITFDSWGRTWVAAFQASEANLGIYPNGGIFMLDFQGSPTNPDDFHWTKVQDNGTVWSLGMGRNDRMYYLTPNGLNYFDLRNSSSPIAQENTYPFFPNISFGAGSNLKVDSHGNVWASSPTDGIRVLLENTTYWPDINGITAENSPLLSNEVLDIAFDDGKNLAYIATSKGVNILRIPFGEKKATYSDIKIFPSPFYIPNDGLMTVDGLPFESAMMVMTLDGKVVRHVPSQGISIDGDQLSWDGRDADGDLVSSGVYLLAIYGNDGAQTVEKITVIKN